MFRREEKIMWQKVIMLQPRFKKIKLFIVSFIQTLNTTKTHLRPLQNAT